MPRKQKASGAAHSNGRALIVLDQGREAYDRAVSMHQQPLPRLIPNFEKALVQIAQANIDEIGPLLNDADKLLACARILENREAEEDWAEIKLRALRHLGEIEQKLQKVGGPGRGKRIAGPGKCFQLKAAGISTSRAHRGKKAFAIPEDEFDRFLAECRQQRRPANFEDMMKTVLKRHQVNGGVRSRPWTNNVEALFGCKASGEKLSAEGETYQRMQRHSVEKQFEIVAATVAKWPDRGDEGEHSRKWRTLLKRFLPDHLNNLLQDLSQRPLAEHHQFLHRLTKGENEQFSSVVDFNEVTREDHEEQERRQPQATKVRRKRNRATAGSQSGSASRCSG
jgi:hypothetical protein